jgi:orotate phosphoribosyltransferase
MDTTVAKALLDIGAVGFAPEQPVTFKSGIISPVYVDNRTLPFHPQQWRVVIEAFAQLAQTIEHDIIAGVAVGGVPHSAALAYHLQRPSVFIRKVAKEHGKAKRIEGGDVGERRVLLIEDLVTTGSSSLSGVDALRDADANVQNVLAIVSYDFAEARAAFQATNITLRTLTTFTTILNVAAARGLFTTKQSDVISDWFNDPRHWATRHGFA